MGQALIARGGGVGGSAKAKVQVIAPLGSTLTISQGDVVFTRDVEVSPVEISLGYGVWTFSASGAATKTIEIDVLKVYEVNVRDVTYGISIDMDNGDPAAAVTYTDDAVGYSALSCNITGDGSCNYGSWENAITGFIGCKPCLVKDGARVAYLNPNNYAQLEDGSEADITSGNAGDVMIEFKKTWYKYGIDGKTLTFQISNYDRSAEGFVCSAFKSMDGTGAVKDYMYFGAYEGYYDGTNCHSLSGKDCINWDTYTSYTGWRDACKARGAKYGMEDWAKRYYILGLLMLVTKTRKIQDALGDGNINDGNEYQTGRINDKGLFFGQNYDSKGCESVKCFGIENMWGNSYSWCDGIITLSESTIGFKECAPYNDSGEGYESVTGTPQGTSGCITSMKPILGGAALTWTAVQSDYTQGWADVGDADDYSGFVANVGGYYSDDASLAGPFYVSVWLIPGLEYVDCSGRLVCA